MKNKSEFFIKHYNYANNYIHIRRTCQVLLAKSLILLINHYFLIVTVFTLLQPE